MRNYSKFTKEQEMFLSEHFQSHSYRELTEMFNERYGTEFTWQKEGYCIIERKCRRMGLSKTRGYGYTEEMNEFLKINAPTHPLSWLCKQMKEKFGVEKSQDALKIHCREILGIRKKAGLVYDYTKDDQKVPIGTVTRQPDGRTRIKVRDSGEGDKVDWEPYGRWVYEQAYGKLPKEMKVLHLDGNSDNNDLENLVAISQYEHCILTVNKWHKKGEVTKAGIAYAKFCEKLKEGQR